MPLTNSTTGDSGTLGFLANRVALSSIKGLFRFDAFGGDTASAIAGESFGVETAIAVDTAGGETASAGDTAGGETVSAGDTFGVETASAGDTFGVDTASAGDTFGVETASADDPFGGESECGRLSSFITISCTETKKANF